MMRTLLMVLTACFLTAGCASTPANVVSAGERYVASSPGDQDGEASYRLDAGDKVRMTVFNEPTLSGEFAVASNGTLSLPLVGEVQALKRTTTEIAAEVQRRLADGYLRDPSVSMEVTTFRPFFILGEVKSPGQYPYASGLTVLNAVATAQGFTPRASKQVAYIRRAGESSEVAYTVTPALRVLPGDTIRFGERYF